GLRLDPRFAGRFDILRRGYQFFRHLQENAQADFYFTSIASDNQRAVSFLERGLPGMPKYQPIADIVTLVIPVRRFPKGRYPESVRTERVSDWDEVVDQLNEHNSQFQLAPAFAGNDLSLASLGLHSHDFRVLKRGNKITCAALWDQRSFKQTVIRGYDTRLKIARPLINFVGRFAGTVELPAAGSVLASASVSHLACNPAHPDGLESLINAVTQLGFEKGIQFLIVGFAANDPRLAMMRTGLKTRQYQSRLYAVHWPNQTPFEKLDGRIVFPELASL